MSRHDQETLAGIFLYMHRDHLVVKTRINGKVYWQEERTDYKNSANYQIDHAVKDYLLVQLLNAVKPILYSMPFGKVDFVISKEVNEKYLDLANHVNVILQNTNQVLARYQHLKAAVTDAYETLLFLNADKAPPAKVLYELMCEIDDRNIIYENFSTGWNSMQRRWEDIDLPWKIDELVDLIISKKIKKIYSINMYFLEQYLNKAGVYLLALFKHLGVEYLIEDIDGHSASVSGYPRRAFLNCDSFDRISPGHDNFYFNALYRMKNPRATVFSQRYHDTVRYEPLRDDYGILVLSNSRYHDLKPMILPILYFMDHFNDRNLVTEPLVFYYAMRYLILEQMNLTVFEKLLYNTKLLGITGNVINILKYEMIESLATDRKIEIYGDQGWKNLFPEYYRERYLNLDEKRALFKENQHVLLLFNWTMSRLFPAVPFLDAMGECVPAINYAPPVETAVRELSGFRHLEYRNPEQLNEKIDSVNEIFSNEELLGSIDSLKQIYNKEHYFKAESIVNGYERENKEQRDYQVLLKREFDCLEKAAVDYVDNNETVMRRIFDVLILGQPVSFDVSKTRFSSRRYVRALLKKD